MTKGALWTAAEAEAATRGVARGAWAATGVAIDSRTLKPGDLFVALVGLNHDGHDFAAAALRAGAAAALVSRVPADLPEGAPLLVVADTLEALYALARAGRLRARARVIAVTGSVGKTSTKEALAHVLGAQGQTHAAVGSYNNAFGVPLTLARLPREAEFGVFEIGMNHAGEIAPLTRLVQPDVALITTIEAVHLENFANIEGIADAKAEIFLGVRPGGAAVLNGDNPFLARLVTHAKEAGIARLLTFGCGAGATARLRNMVLEADGSRVEAAIGGYEVAYRIGAPGEHWVMNSLAVLAGVAALGADPARAAAALAGMKAPAGRGRRHSLDLGTGMATLLDDSYNASPASMRAAFALLALTPVGPGGRRIAVLGDMLELGAGAGALHAALAHPIEAARIDLTFTAGRNMQRLHEALPASLRGAHVAAAADLALPLLAALRPGDTVLVKGSHGSRMHLVVERLLRSAAA